MSLRAIRSALIAGGAAVTAAVVLAAPAAAQNPPGNNGTVKVDDVEFDDHPDNEPHVGCVFQIDFYGYDEGDLFADVTFTAVPPTGSNEVLLTDTVFIGEDDNSGGGSEAGLDASATYDLSDALAGFTPHPVQGHHVRLTVNADGSQGADVKHKVFWVEGCVPPTTTTESTTTTTEKHGTTTTTEKHGTTTTTAKHETTTTAEHGTTTTLDGETTTTAGAGTVPETPGDTTPTGELARTGSSTGPLVALAAAMVVLGGAGMLTGRRLRSLDNS
jgi:hypothetical protein